MPVSKAFVTATFVLSLSLGTEKAQEKAGEAREALDFVKQKEFDVLQELVEGLDIRGGKIEKELDTEGGESADS